MCRGSGKCTRYCLGSLWLGYLGKEMLHCLCSAIKELGDLCLVTVRF